MKKVEEVILFQIDLTSKVSKQYSQREFNALGLGITVEQWIILKIISESDAISQKELAQESYRDTASITRTLDLLEKKGYTIREPIPNNRRAYNIILTKSGDKFLEENMSLIKKHRQKSIENLTKDELKTLSELLSKIRKNME